jgi:hypothetical protein
MRDLDGLHDTAKLDMLVAPIELADLARCKRQRTYLLNPPFNPGFTRQFGRAPTDPKKRLTRHRSSRV